MNNIPPQFPKYFWYCKIFCRRLYQFAFKIFWRWYNKCDTLLHQSGHWRLVKIILRLLDPNRRPTSCYPRWESRKSEWAVLQLSPVKRFSLNLNEYAQGHMLSICTTISFKIIVQTLRIFTQWLRKNRSNRLHLEENERLSALKQAIPFIILGLRDDLKNAPPPTLQLGSFGFSQPDCNKKALHGRYKSIWQDSPKQRLPMYQTTALVQYPLHGEKKTYVIGSVS